MALSRFTVTKTVTILPSGATAADFGSVTTAPVNTDQWNPLLPATFFAGQVVWADSAAPSGAGTGAQQLYQALNAANAIRAYTDGDAVGHAATSN